MRKISITAILVLLLLPVTAMAEMSWYGAADLSMPMGDFSDAAGMGYGGAIGVSYPYTDAINLRAQGGYWMYSEELTDWTYSAIPIMAFAEYHWDTDMPAYLLGGAGITMMNWDGPTVLGIDLSGDKNEFSIGAGAGYSLNDAISIEGMYLIISDANQIGFQLIYGF